VSEFIIVDHFSLMTGIRSKPRSSNSDRSRPHESSHSDSSSRLLQSRDSVHVRAAGADPTDHIQPEIHHSRQGGHSRTVVRLPVVAVIWSAW